MYSEYGLIYTGVLTDYPHPQRDGTKDYTPKDGYNALLANLTNRGYRSAFRYLTNI